MRNWLLSVFFLISNGGFEFFFCLIRASDKCQKEKRKTVNGEDLLWAMSTLGFEDYLEPLKVYLARYREVSYISLLLLSSCYVRLILSFHLPVYVCMVAETILMLQLEVIKNPIRHHFHIFILPLQEFYVRNCSLVAYIYDRGIIRAQERAGTVTIEMQLGVFPGKSCR